MCNESVLSCRNISLSKCVYLLKAYVTHWLSAQVRPQLPGLISMGRMFFFSPNNYMYSVNLVFLVFYMIWSPKFVSLFFNLTWLECAGGGLEPTSFTLTTGLTTSEHSSAINQPTSSKFSVNPFISYNVKWC